MSDNLPPLPPHPEHGWVWTDAEQRAIRAYAAAAVAAERERCKARALTIVEWHRNAYNGSQIGPIVSMLKSDSFKATLEGGNK